MRKKAVLISTFIFFSLAFLGFYQWWHFFDGKLHITFCDAGQGDAIYIRTPKSFDILVDGGPDDKVLSCLGKHMPFWDRTIDIVILTHPHADHLIGLISVLQRYQVMSFATEKLENDTLVFKELNKLLQDKHISTRYFLAGQRVRLPDKVFLTIVGPTRSFLQKTSPGGKIGESKEFGSLETLVSYETFQLLLTGDSQAEELQEAIDTGYLTGVNVLQVPHHGSKTGLTDNIIKTLYPKLAIISVGKNKYGHPTREIIGKLGSMGVKILRTDTHGDIEIVSDGKSYLAN